MAPKTEQIENATSTTTLNGGINDVVTSVVVADGSIFPADGNYVIRCEDELMRVTARSTNTLTVTRGYAGSTAVSHTTGVDVWQTVEKDALLAYIAEQGHSRMISQSDGQKHRILDTDGVTLATADFTVVSTGTSEDDLSWGGMRQVPAPISGIRTQPMVKTQPSTPYTLTAHVATDTPADYGTSSNLFGICLRESSTGRMFLTWARPGDRIQTNRMTDASTFSTALGQIDFFRRLDAWFRITNDGVDMNASVSFDGVNFLQIATDTVGTYLTPNQVGWFGANRSGTGHWFLCNSFLES